MILRIMNSQMQINIFSPDNRKLVCEEFGVKLTSTLFATNASNQCADNNGFKTDREIR